MTYYYSLKIKIAGKNSIAKSNKRIIDLMINRLMSKLTENNI